MKFFSYFVVGITCAIGLIYLVGMILPGDYSIKSEITIDASQETVFNQLNDLHNWEHWAMPSREEVQNYMITYEGADTGAGSILHWNTAESQGSLKIIESIPFEKIVCEKIDSKLPSITIFELKNLEGKTSITWTDNGNFGWNATARIFAAVADFEKAIGENYRLQLLLLKKKIEAQENEISRS